MGKTTHSDTKCSVTCPRALSVGGLLRALGHARFYRDEQPWPAAEGDRREVRRRQHLQNSHSCAKLPLLPPSRNPSSSLLFFFCRERLEKILVAATMARAKEEEDLTALEQAEDMHEKQLRLQARQRHDMEKRRVLHQDADEKFNRLLDHGYNKQVQADERLRARAKAQEDVTKAKQEKFQAKRAQILAAVRASCLKPVGRPPTPHQHPPTMKRTRPSCAAPNWSSALALARAETHRAAGPGAGDQGHQPWQRGRRRQGQDRPISDAGGAEGKGTDAAEGRAGQPAGLVAAAGGAGQSRSERDDGQHWEHIGGQARGDEGAAAGGRAGDTACADTEGAGPAGGYPAAEGRAARPDHAPADDAYAGRVSGGGADRGGGGGR